MQILYSILASIAVVAGAAGSLCLFVLCIAGSPNSSDAQIRVIKMLMLASVVGGLMCLAGGIFLIVRSHPVAGGIVGALPIITLFALMIWAEVS